VFVLRDLLTTYALTAYAMTRAPRGTQPVIRAGAEAEVSRRGVGMVAKQAMADRTPIRRRVHPSATTARKTNAQA